MRLNFNHPLSTFYYLNIMKSDIHPPYFTESKVTCACWSSFLVGSTLPKISVEICSACHPLYTGEEKILDTAGRVEKFKARRAKSEQKKTEQKKKTKKKKKTQNRFFL